jgi:uncharacterized membrane protein HdeD (DUF308 family)
MNGQGEGVKRFATGGMIFGVVLVVLGMLSIMAPMITGVVVAVMVGIFMVSAGIFRLIWAFGSDSFGRGILTFILGGLFIVTGFLMIFRPLAGLASLALIMAAFFLVDGIFEIVAALSHRPEKGWGWLVFGGVVSIALAVMIWRQWPLSGAWAIGILAGVKMLFAGLGMIAVASAARRLAEECGTDV